MNHTDKFNQIMNANKPAKKMKQVQVKVELIGERESMNAMQTDLSKCTISGNVVSLPFEQLPNYAEVRKALLNAGATYNKSKFVFPNDAKPYIDRLMGGESVNIKKEFQFYATPAELAKYLVSIANVKKGETVLEPSAGQGAIVDEILLKKPLNHVFICEHMTINMEVLIKKYIGKENIFIVHPLNDDFLEFTEVEQFDVIIANPPFSKNQDIDHIRKMYEVCKPGGRIVTIASKHWQHSKSKKECAFRSWLDEIGAEVEEIPREAFKESGTSVATCIIIINK